MTDCEKILLELKEILWHKRKHLPKRLGFIYRFENLGVRGIKENKMQFSGAVPGSTVSVSVVGLNADGSQNPAVLSAQAFTTADPSVATVAVQPDGTAIITLVATPPADGVTAVNTVLNATATATIGSVSGQVSGSDAISFVGSTIVPPALPTSLGFTFGPLTAPGGVPQPPPVPSPLKKF